MGVAIDCYYIVCVAGLNHAASINVRKTVKSVSSGAGAQLMAFHPAHCNKICKCQR